MAADPSPSPADDAGLTARRVRNGWAQLNRMHGPGEQRAVLLALLLTPDNAAERQAWQEETRGVFGAGEALELIEGLPAQARAPLLEHFARRMSGASLMQRQDLLGSARRLMCADQRVSPLDRLHLLLLRHLLGSHGTLHRGGLRDSNELWGLPLALRQAAARLSAYLARLVPQPDPASVVGLAGTAWYQGVMQHLWRDAQQAPACQVPDGDGLVRSLQTLGALAWTYRPMLARTWVDQALAHGPQPLNLVSAEALSAVCHLLDTPLPPALAACFTVLPEEAATSTGR